MDCNKVDANQAVQIALMKFHENDVHAAKRFALKAQKLFPELEGIQQLVETLNIHSSAAKINGVMDWYAILSVNSSDNEEEIKKSYKKMLLMVHPDKNKWDGAETAFRLVTEAWNMLKDKDKRAAYDHSRKGKQTCQDRPTRKDYNIVDNNVKSPTSAPAAPRATPVENPAYQKGSELSKKKQAQQWTSRAKSKRVCLSRPATFWTACTHCKFKFEFQRIFVNAKLLCPRADCKKIYSAVETSPPHGWKKSEKSASAISKRKKSNKFTASGDPPTSLSHASKNPQVPYFGTKITGAPVIATTHAESGKTVENITQEEQPILYNKNTNCRNEKRTSACLQRDLGSDGNPSKKSRIYSNAMQKDSTCNNGESVFRTDKIINNLDKVSRKRAKENLTKLAKAAIGKKLIEWNNKADVVATKPFQAHSSGIKSMKLKGSSSFREEKIFDVDVPSPEKDGSDTGMKVPDQDFHNFDNRGKWKFEKGQVWALYDDPHGLPRLYAAIENLVSQRPLKVMIRWLHSDSNEEFGPMEWISSGFQKTSGVFIKGTRDLVDAELCFSHIVSCKAGSQGVTHIYPKKGDVWAVYKNWSPDWDVSVRHSPEIFNQFNIVEVLCDYSDESGITIAPLIKVPGFKSVMKRNSDPASHMTFPKHEIFKLSHQVPFCLLTKDNYPGSPTGCIEIDLGAVPFEFA